MTHKYLSILFLLPIHLSFGQPVLTQPNTGPVIGESFVLNRFDWDGDSQGTGVNQTWDYSGIVTTSTTATSIVNPNTMPSSSSFPAANTGINYASTQYEYNLINATNWSREGFYAGGVAIPYQNSELLITYPFEYTDTYVDPFSSTFVSGGTWYREGDVTVTADAYGSLILPSGTVPDVLRVKVYEDYGDTYGGSELYHYYTTIYMFYRPGYHFPILSLTNYIQGATTVNYGNYIDDATLSIKPETSVASINLYPSPAHHQVSLDLGKYAAEFERIEIYDLSGKLVYLNQNLPQTIDVSDLLTGVYVVHIYLNEEKIVRKFVKE